MSPVLLTLLAVLPVAAPRPAVGEMIHDKSGRLLWTSPPVSDSHVRYASVREIRKRLHLSAARLYDMIDKGKVRYA